VESEKAGENVRARYSIKFGRKKPALLLHPRLTKPGRDMGWQRAPYAYRTTLSVPSLLFPVPEFISRVVGSRAEEIERGSDQRGRGAAGHLAGCGRGIARMGTR